MKAERRPESAVPESGSSTNLDRDTVAAGSPDALLDAEQVAALLNVHASWVLSAARSGVLPSVALGRWRRFRRSSVLSWVEELETPARASVPGLWGLWGLWGFGVLRRTRVRAS